jgi:hypothetical protein
MVQAHRISFPEVRGVQDELRSQFDRFEEITLLVAENMLIAGRRRK